MPVVENKEKILIEKVYIEHPLTTFIIMKPSQY